MATQIKSRRKSKTLHSFQEMKQELLSEHVRLSIKKNPNIVEPVYHRIERNRKTNKLIATGINTGRKYTADYQSTIKSADYKAALESIQSDD